MPDIDTTSPVPLYYQLKTLILEDIVSGKYQPGDRLPTEHELCDRHGISRTPAHRALSELADEGVIIRARRRGTFVNPHWVPRRGTTSELRMMVTDEHWADHIRANAPDQLPVSVVVVSFAEMRHTLTASVAEGRAPDIAILDEVWIADFADAGFLLPLDELDADWVVESYEKDFVAAFVQGHRFNGRVYAVPEEINVAGLWCCRESLDSVDMGLPTTWDELSELARRLKPSMRSGDRVLSIPGGHVAAETTSYCLLAVLASNGVSVIDEAVRLDSAAAVDTLRFLRSFVDEGTMTADVVTYDWTRCPHLLGSGHTAVTVGGSYEAETIANAAGIPLADVTHHFAFAPFPAGPQGAAATVAGGMAYVVFRQAADPKRAWRLLEHIVEPDQLAQRARGRSSIPPRYSSIAELAAESRFTSEAAELFATAVTRPSIADYHLVSIQIQNMLEAVLTGRHGPAAAAERTAEIISAITGLPIERS